MLRLVLTGVDKRHTETRRRARGARREEGAYQGDIRPPTQHSGSARGVRVVLCPSGEDDAWQGVRGRVQEVARSLAFGGAPPGEAVAFVSGMTAMVDDVRRTLAAAGVPPDRVHVNF